MTTSPSIPCLLNMDAVRKMYENAWREGFRDGADHGNLDYKYPPEDIAWRIHKRGQHDLFVCLTRDELKSIQEWEEADYDRRTKACQWSLDAEETQGEHQP